MKKRLILAFISLATLCILHPSCIRQVEMDNTPEGNFETLWQLIDEQYCFLNYKKQEYGLDWNEVYSRYSRRIIPSMPASGLFEVLGEMLDELRDGHVNLYWKGDMARYWDWFEAYPTNFSDSIQRNYLGTDYKIASGLKYKILEDNIGYVYYESFSSAIGSGNIDQMLHDMSLCQGLIIDVRNNGGGMLTNSSKLASRFTNEKVLIGFIQHKTGKGHSDFSKPAPIYLEPSDRIRWQKKVVVLTNRHSYSATNDFVNSMKQLPNVTIIGDRTGGGSGMPASSELPNGWSIRFSSSPHLDANKQHIEFGIDPDIKVDMASDDIQKGIDTIIETARTFLKK